MSLFTIAKELRKRGVLGINGRNANFISMYNQRKYFPNADSKLRSKTLALEGGLPVPDLYGVIERSSQIEKIYQIAREKKELVLKPEHGAGGEGILILHYHEEEGLCTPSGQKIDREELRVHVNDTVSGLFSLGGQPDRLLMEYKVSFASSFDHITFKGVPDIRIIAFLGIPVFAMLRLPTRESQGKANLHQGAIGVGVNMVTGVTQDGVQGTRRVKRHPDTGEVLEGLEIPQWSTMLSIAAKSYELFHLGYMGIDLVLDRDRGPMMLEVNVRPGLAIQLANNRGLKPRLKYVERVAMQRTLTIEERLALVTDLHDL